MIKFSKSSRANNAALVLSSPRHMNEGVSSSATLSATKNAGKPKMSVQHRNKNAVDLDSLEISEILTKRYRGISLYGAVMILLAIGIIWTAVLTAEQVQQYHQSYMSLQKMKAEHRKLQIENQRLVIEQQTFSATPQIASRAITELGMYSPTTKDKLILQPKSMHESAASNVPLENDSSPVSNVELTPNTVSNAEPSIETTEQPNTAPANQENVTMQQEANND